ncbi:MULTISPECIES: mercury(II) reductase [unclassified Haloferax]|uniref:mercury(II) reductase n=1 Tax=unclassified Haloferax TaxID=2625095 RepID=UPI002874B4A3|nr:MULTISPECIES: mercury(II) reductase [unclassified Haloferax]MDS0243715.1 mercury(II) reductase [Haloferax sp. S2CR25]MDS0446836.1 mercury(II) reductase [Haloferax sp. S2CR25-2]
MTSSGSYDLVVLGGGAAAFAAITEADRRGLSTAIVNTGLPLGGTCVNVGCVPSKHLLEVGKTAFEPPRNPFIAVCYEDGQPTIDWAAAIDEKDGIVSSLREQNYVNVAEHFETDIYEGYGRFVDGVEQRSTSNQPTSGDDVTIEIVDGEDAGSVITGEKALVATGSSPYIAPIEGIEDVAFETSETILDRRNLPESVVIVGGGYVALEWGQILHHMGTDVTILQRSDHVLSGMEGQLGRELQRCFEEEGISVVTNVAVDRVKETTVTDGVSSIGVEATVEGDARTFTASDLFVATGVQPNTEDIGLNKISVETDDTGSVIVDDKFRTTNPDVYAAGDCIGEPMLETVAAKEGNHAVKNAFGDERVAIDYNAVPKVVFTSPEVAAVGTTELEYMDEHGTCSCRTVEMADVPKAKAVKDTRGLVQVVKHHETDEIVGVHMVGPRAADMIPEATLAVKFGLTVDDIIDTIHPFPTFSEAFKHACQAFRRDVSTMSCCVE